MSLSAKIFIGNLVTVGATLGLLFGLIASLHGIIMGATRQVFALARDLNQRVLGREVIPANLYDGTTVPRSSSRYSEYCGST